MSEFDRAIQEAKKLAATPEGRQLASRLQQLGGPDLNQAMESGDLNRLKQSLSLLLKDPGARHLLEKLGGNHG